MQNKKREELYRRLDKMTEIEDYNPYSALKKSIVDESELFSPEVYEIDEDNLDNFRGQESKCHIIGLVVIMMGMLSMIGVLVFLVLRAYGKID